MGGTPTQEETYKGEYGKGVHDSHMPGERLRCAQEMPMTFLTW